MLPDVTLHIYLGDGHGHGPFQGLENGRRIAGDRQNAAVVAGVARPIQQVGARDGLDRRRELVDDLDAAALTEVGDRLDELRHSSSVVCRPSAPPMPTPPAAALPDECFDRRTRPNARSHYPDGIGASIASQPETESGCHLEPSAQKAPPAPKALQSPARKPGLLVGGAFGADGSRCQPDSVSGCDAIEAPIPSG